MLDGAGYCWVLDGAGRVQDGASASRTLAQARAGHKREVDQDYKWMVLDNVGCRMMLDSVGCWMVLDGCRMVQV